MRGFKLKIRNWLGMEVFFSKFQIPSFLLAAILSGLFLFVAGARPCLATNETTQASLPPAAAAEGEIKKGRQLRDPFWPIGFLPASDAFRQRQSAVSEQGSGKASGLPDILQIGGIIKKGNTYYAVINGVMVRTGEVVSAIANGEVYKFVVETIDFKRVQVKPLKE